MPARWQATQSHDRSALQYVSNDLIAHTPVGDFV